MEKPNLDGKIELDEVLLRALNNTKAFIDQLEDEEAGERIETVDSIRNRMKADKTNTDRKKNKFIEEMKNGLGQEIIEKKGRGIIVKQPTILERFKKTIIKLYSKF